MEGERPKIVTSAKAIVIEEEMIRNDDGKRLVRQASEAYDR